MNITRAEAWQLHKAVNTAKGNLCRHGSPLVCRPTSAYDHIALLSTSPSSSSLPSVGSPGTPPRHAGPTGPPNCGTATAAAGGIVITVC